MNAENTVKTILKKKKKINTQNSNSHWANKYKRKCILHEDLTKLSHFQLVDQWIITYDGYLLST